MTTEEQVELAKQAAFQIGYREGQRQAYQRAAEIARHINWQDDTLATLSDRIAQAIERRMPK